MLLPQSLRKQLNKVPGAGATYRILTKTILHKCYQISFIKYMCNIYRYWKDSKSLKVKEYKDFLTVEIKKYKNIDIGSHTFKIVKYDIAITSEFGSVNVPMSHLKRCNKGSYKQITQSLFVRNREIWGYLKHYKPKFGDIIIDAGAYWGDTTIPFAKMVGKEGKVIALEPVPHIFTPLEKNILINALDNVILLREALFGKIGVQNFKLTDNWYPVDYFDPSERIWQLPTTTIDELVERFKLNKVDFIKMDIEGSEIEAIKGAKETIRKFHPAFAISSHHVRDGRQTREVIEPMLNEYRYKVFTEYPLHLTTYAIWQKDSS